MSCEATSDLRIAVINCPGSFKFDPLFVRWIDDVSLPLGQKVEWSVFEAEANELSKIEENFDAYIITGSRHGVYEELPWITGLLSWIKATHEKQKNILGVCFGHQAVAKALGGNVEVNPNGFEIGRYTTAVSDEAVAYFKLLGTWDQLETTTSPPSIDMMFVHGDYVVPSGVPPGLTSMGGTPLSPHNGFFNGTNILTFQGHAEFDVESVELCIEKLSEKGILPKRLPPGATLEQVKATLGGRVDAQWIALTALRFFQNESINQR